MGKGTGRLFRGFVHESSKNETAEWYTPPEIFDALGMTFDLDVASPGAQVVPWIPAKKHLTILDDGLAHAWTGLIWLNPPYGTKTPEWIGRFNKHVGGGILLVFARTETNWFHRGVRAWDGLCFVHGRISFIRGDGYRGRGCGAASMLAAREDVACEALRKSGLGFFIDLRREGQEALRTEAP